MHSTHSNKHMCVLNFRDAIFRSRHYIALPCLTYKSIVQNKRGITLKLYRNFHSWRVWETIHKPQMSVQYACTSNDIQFIGLFQTHELSSVSNFHTHIIQQTFAGQYHPSTKNTLVLGSLKSKLLVNLYQRQSVSTLIGLPPRLFLCLFLYVVCVSSLLIVYKK